MRCVYLVEVGEYEERHIVAAFNDEEVAKECAAILEKNYDDRARERAKKHKGQIGAAGFIEPEDRAWRAYSVSQLEVFSSLKDAKGEMDLSIGTDR